MHRSPPPGNREQKGDAKWWPSNQQKKKTHKHKQIRGIVPGLGGRQKSVYVFFWDIPYGEKHINKIPPKIRGQSREDVVYVLFSLCVFRFQEMVALKSVHVSFLLIPNFYVFFLIAFSAAYPKDRAVPKKQWNSESLCRSVFTIGSRAGKPNKERAKTKSSYEFRPLLCEFWSFFLGKMQARFTSNFCSGMPPAKVHELPFFGLVCRGDF